MPKAKDIFVQEFKSRPFGYVMQAIGVIVILLNLWLVNKLSPLAKNIDQIIIKVQALEERTDDLEVNAESSSELLVKAEGLRITVEEINKRLERIDSRLAKHMGI